MFVGMECCGSGDAISYTPTFLNDITYISISNGIYDELFGTDNPNVEMNSSSKKWDYDTRFYAKFQNNLVAGNVDYAASMVSSMRVKRRKNNEHQWFTMFDIPIETNDDFEFELVDRYAQGSQATAQRRLRAGDYQRRIDRRRECSQKLSAERHSSCRLY